MNKFFSVVASLLPPEALFWEEVLGRALYPNANFTQVGLTIPLTSLYKF